MNLQIVGYRSNDIFLFKKKMKKYYDAVGKESIIDQTTLAPQSEQSVHTGGRLLCTKHNKETKILWKSMKKKEAE